MNADGQILPREDGPLETRSGLIRRLANWDDSRSWSEFFETYWRFIYRCAIKAGLTEDEAQEVVQGTVLTVAKKIQDNQYEYHRGEAKFKTFLWRIVHYQILRRKRLRDEHNRRFVELRIGSDDNTEESLFEQTVDQRNELQQAWEAEWIQNQVDAAAERVKRTNPRDYQVFDYRVVQQHPASVTARAFNISVPRVYVVVHRVRNLLKKEIERRWAREGMLPAGSHCA